MAFLREKCWMLFLVMVAVDIQNASGALHVLGGTKYQGWKPDSNYTEWAAKERFVLGDWLYWGYDKHFYSVYRVNYTSYMSCNTNDPIKNITGGAGRDVFQLLEPITYYFISAGGWCWHGMKVAIPVNLSGTSTIAEAQNGAS
ncbi:hypothetical protein ACHQM5_008974 [Ranunculus cassubicifolius]